MRDSNKCCCVYESLTYIVSHNMFIYTHYWPRNPQNTAKFWKFEKLLKMGYQIQKVLRRVTKKLILDQKAQTSFPSITYKTYDKNTDENYDYIIEVGGLCY